MNFALPLRSQEKIVFVTSEDKAAIDGLRSLIGKTIQLNAGAEGVQVRSPLLSPCWTGSPHCPTSSIGLRFVVYSVWLILGGSPQSLPRDALLWHLASQVQEATGASQVRPRAKIAEALSKGSKAVNSHPSRACLRSPGLFVGLCLGSLMLSMLLRAA